MLKEYFHKMKGTTKSPPAVSLSEVLWSWTGAFLGIASAAYINFNRLEGTDLVMIIGSLVTSDKKTATYIVGYEFISIRSL